MDNNKINEAALTKRLKTLVLQGRFEDAQKELEGIDIQRLKNNSILCLVGEVYMGLGEYNEAERVLLRVYEKNPTARRILDLLTTLYIEKKEYSEAEYYYKEFISVASKDLHRYILRYRIDKGKKERLSVLIHTLEKLKEYEYIEEWAYELAELYDQSGQKKKCLHECEEIVLWFGHGEYVDKAIALRCKLTGEPLPEMTTVEMYKAEEERRAREKREQEMVYAEISRRNANPVLDGLEDVFDGSIDTEMIQQALEDRSDAPNREKVIAKDEPAKTEKAEEQEAPAENAMAEPASDQQEEIAAEKEEVLTGHAAEGETVDAAAEEEDDEVIPEGELEAAEKDEKESISQIFGNLMSGKLFGRLRQNRKEETAEEGQEEAVQAAETDDKTIEAAETAQAPAETAEAAESAADAEDADSQEDVTEIADIPAEAGTESSDTVIAEAQEHTDEDQDDEVLAEELDLSIFEMKADQDFEDSIIQNMDAAIKATFGEQTEEEAPAEAAEEENALVEAVAETVEETAETSEEDISAEEDEIIEALPEDEEEITEKLLEEVEKAEPAEEKTVEEQAASFAEAITAAVGAPSNFISDQTEKFMSDDEEAEEDEIAEELPEDEEEIAEELPGEAEVVSEEAEEVPEEAEEVPEEAEEVPEEAEEVPEEAEEVPEEAEEVPEEAEEVLEEAEEIPEEVEEAAQEQAEEKEEITEEPAVETESDNEVETEDEVDSISVIGEKEETEVETEESEEEEMAIENQADETDADDKAEDEIIETAEDEVIEENDDEDEDEIIEDDDKDEDELIEDDDEDEDELIEEDDEDEDEIIEDDDEDEDEIIEDDDEDEDEIIEDDDEDEDEIIAEGGDTDFIRSLFAQEKTGASMEEVKEVIPEEKPEEAAEEDDFEDEFSDSLQASDTVLDIFGAVANVKSIQQQLTETFTKFEFQDNIDLLAPYDINFVVTGEDMSVKSQIAIGIAKALNTYQICDKNKLVRASAADLNKRDFGSIFEKIKGGCLIIESADQLNENAVQIISDYIQKDNQDVAIVLEGEEKPLMEMFSHNRLLRQRFLNIIHIGKYNESELVQLAIAYAKKKGYEVSRDAAPVLKQLFRERMAKGESVNYEDIIVIVENAISSLEKRNMENLFMTVLDNKYEEAAMFLLQPQDFQITDEEADE